MSAEALLDTNVLVYAQDADEPIKRAQAIALLESLRGVRVAVTTQVMAEYFVTVRRKFSDRMDEGTAASQVRDFSQMFEVIDVGLTTVLESVRAVLRYRLSYYDAQVWAAARQGGVALVLSEDFQDGREIEGVRFADPFSSKFDLSRLLVDGER
jgi:predicted nucleic acid-binding protein